MLMACDGPVTMMSASGNPQVFRECPANATSAGTRHDAADRIAARLFFGSTPHHSMSRSAKADHHTLTSPVCRICTGTPEEPDVFNSPVARRPRGSRSAQRAHAILLLPALLQDLSRDGVAPEVIAELDLVDISQKAAERFDRGVNGARTTRRLFGLRGPTQGPA